MDVLTWLTFMAFSVGLSTEVLCFDTLDSRLRGNDGRGGNDGGGGNDGRGGNHGGGGNDGVWPVNGPFHHQHQRPR